MGNYQIALQEIDEMIQLTRKIYGHDQSALNYT